MNITTKIIITDTNIITDLDNANILEKFIDIDNVYISDMVKNDEINSKTGNVKLINKFKVISATANQLIEVNNLSYTEKNYLHMIYLILLYQEIIIVYLLLVIID